MVKIIIPLFPEKGNTIKIGKDSYEISEIKGAGQGNSLITAEKKKVEATQVDATIDEA